MSDISITTSGDAKADAADFLTKQLAIRGKIRIALSICVLFALPWFILLDFSANPVPDIQGVVLSQASDIAPFSLQSHENKVFSEVDLIGKWHFIAYGYSQCPDICPTTLMSLNALAHAIKETPSLEEKIKASQFIFYTVDPTRDTLAVLASYIQYFNPDFIALRSHHGDAKQGQGKAIEALAFEKSVGIKAIVNPANEERNSYRVSHSVSILLTNPEGKLQAVFFADKNQTAPTHFDSENLYRDFLTVIDYYQTKKP